MTRWIVDGMNVIGSRPDGWWRDRTGAMARLLAGLETWAAGHGDPVLLVLDGRPRDIGAAAGGRVDVAFAPGGRDAADDEIALRVRADPDPGELRVVTSDAGLAARVRATGAEVVGAGAFRRLADL